MQVGQKIFRRFVLALLAAMTPLSVVQPGHAAYLGPDVSSWQHPGNASIDWSQVKAAGIPFAFIKATEDTNYQNGYFPGDWASVRANGMYRGAYHFARPATSATAQADYFVSYAGRSRLQGDLPPVLDLEDNGKLPPTALIAWTHAFLSRVQELTGRTAMIYVSPNFWINAMGDSHEFTNYPLWIARWTSAATPDPLPGGWKSWTFWQYTDAGSIAGIPARVDVSRYCCDAQSLGGLALGAVLPPPGNYHPITPRRIVDTRSDSRLGPWSRVGAGQVLTLQVAGTSQSGLPASGVASVVVNLTAANTSWWGYLTAFQTGGQPGSTSTVNFAQARAAANTAVVPLGPWRHEHLQFRRLDRRCRRRRRF
jgi:lysozyme